jgi:hypothetical protein
MVAEPLTQAAQLAAVQAATEGDVREYVRVGSCAVGWSVMPSPTCTPAVRMQQQRLKSHACNTRTSKHQTTRSG